MLVAADREAREAGYDRDVVRLAVYAFVAFLDESVLNSPQDMFSEWPRRPLQEEVFGDHRAGETFFQNMRDLLSRPDSRALADVLEVYLLCLLLGYRGRYGSGSRARSPPPGVPPAPSGSRAAETRGCAVSCWARASSPAWP